MSNDEFTKLFKYMQKEFEKIDERFDVQVRKIDDIHKGIDSIAK